MRLTITAALVTIFLLATVGGCDWSSDTGENGKATAGTLTKAIEHVCGTTEHREAGGPRTITPIDLDGQYGPTGYLVTCVNGQTEYVKATK